MERKGDVAVSQERESKGKIASEEGVSRYQYEGKITELEEQCSLKDKEIARLQHLLSSQKEAENTEIANLRAEVGRLTQDIRSSDDAKQKLQDLLSTQSVELTALKVKLESKSRLATDYTSLAKELTEEKLRSQDSDLRRKWKQLEQDHLLLQRDYDTLAAMHKRALKDLKRVQSEESRSSKSKPSDDMRRHYEGKMQGMEEETQYLKEKIRKLVSQYYHALEKLQRDNKQLKQDQARLSVETGEQLKGLERRVTELRRSRTRS
jgi:chromosome segregation ATPase